MRVVHQADVARAGFLHFFPCTLLCQLQDTFCRTCWSFLICTPAIGRFAERSECGPTIAGFFLPASVPFTARGVNVEWEGGRMDQARVRCREGAWAQLPNAIQNTFDSYSIPIGWRQLKP